MNRGISDPYIVLPRFLTRNQYVLSPGPLGMKYEVCSLSTELRVPFSMPGTPLDIPKMHAYVAGRAWIISSQLDNQGKKKKEHAYLFPLMGLSMLGLFVELPATFASGPLSESHLLQR